jgi:putative multiple sugar transport system substrate-binding protein
VFRDPRVLAQAAATIAGDLARGKQPPVNDLKAYDNGAKIVPTYLLLPVSIDQSNYQQTLVASGYYQP